MDQEVAKLWLYGSVLSTTRTKIGVRSVDFRNILFVFDLRLVLGETLFEKYEAFKVFISHGNIGGSAAASISTMLINGLNIIQASYQGKNQGYDTAVATFNQGVTFADFGANLTTPINTREFVMIKPNDSQVELNITFDPDDGIMSNIASSFFFLTFVPFEKEKIYKNPYNYLFQNELANFTLTTQILSAGATNKYGTMTSSFTQFTFTNVNMRQIIGTLWDKYDKFNLVCLTIGVGNTATILSGAQRFLWFQIQGLQFINSLATISTTSYSQGVGYTPIFRYTVASTTEADCFDVPSNLLSFRKPESESVDLAFQMFTGNGGGTALTVQMNQFSFTFAVVGIKE
jgi:hypothetical protein